MSEIRCAVCGRVLEPKEIRIVERSLRRSTRKSRYLCAACRKKEYDDYVDSIKN